MRRRDVAGTEAGPAWASGGRKIIQERKRALGAALEETKPLPAASPRLWIRAWSLASLSPEFTLSPHLRPPTADARVRGWGRAPCCFREAALQMAFSVSISPSCPGGRALLPSCQGLSCSSEARVPVLALVPLGTAQGSVAWPPPGP